MTAYVFLLPLLLGFVLVGLSAWPPTASTWSRCPDSCPAFGGETRSEAGKSLRRTTLLGGGATTLLGSVPVLDGAYDEVEVLAHNKVAFGAP